MSKREQERKSKSELALEIHDAVYYGDLDYNAVDSCCGVLDVTNIQDLTSQRDNNAAYARAISQRTREVLRANKQGLAIAFVTSKQSLAVLTKNGWTNVGSFRNPGTGNLVYCLHLKQARAR